MSSLLLCQQPLTSRRYLHQLIRLLSPPSSLIRLWNDRWPTSWRTVEIMCSRNLSSYWYRTRRVWLPVVLELARNWRFRIIWRCCLFLCLDFWRTWVQLAMRALLSTLTDPSPGWNSTECTDSSWYPSLFSGSPHVSPFTSSNPLHLSNVLLIA